MAVKPVNANDQIFIQPGFQTVQTVVIPESVAFFAASNQIAFVTNRVLTHGFFNGESIFVDPTFEPIIIQDVQNKSIRGRIFRRR